MLINEYVELTGRTDNDSEGKAHNYGLGLIGVTLSKKENCTFRHNLDTF